VPDEHAEVGDVSSLAVAEITFWGTCEEVGEVLQTHGRCNGQRERHQYQDYEPE